MHSEVLWKCEGKVENRLEAVSPPSALVTPSNKKIKLDSTVMETEEQQGWVQCGGIFLSITDKESIANGEQLNDEHVNFA